MKFWISVLTLALACGRLLASPSAAGSCCQPPPSPAPKPAACCKPEQPASAGFTRDSLYQIDATYTDDSGRAFALGDLRGRPVVLTMFFATCGYACPLLVADMHRLRELLPAETRDATAFVLVSFDTVRDTPAALAAFRAQRSLDRNWTLLHGSDDAVRELAALLGVKYKREADGSFSHSNLFTILNSEGEIVHRRSGLQGGLPEAAAALVAAAL